jgi:peroxiredoxin|tara:strand:- start:2634 stop:3194 length:561 start_codon:yes stop_codon:yes gene_type:complete
VLKSKNEVKRGYDSHLSFFNMIKMKLHNFTFKFIQKNKWVEKSTDDLFKNKKIIMFGLPGAFTPTCSSKHLPGYDKWYKTFIDMGINDVYCISVNDVFVMNAWAESLKIENVKLIPDGTGEFTRSLNMLVDKPGLGFGLRSWRYSCLIDNTIIEKMFVEDGLNNLSIDADPYEVSDPETMLNYIKD